MRYLIFLAAIFVLPSSADPLVDKYGLLPQIQKMSVSPNGERVAYRQVTLEKDIISVIDVIKGKSVIAFDVSSVKPNNVRFIDDENLLLNISKITHIPGFRGDFEMSTASTFSIKKKKYKQLLIPGRDDVYIGQQGIGEIVGISPDGKSVYMPAFSGEPMQSNGRSIPPAYSLFKVRFSGGGKPKIAKRGKDNARDYFVAGDGSLLAREEFDETKNKHSITSFLGKGSREIYSVETPYITNSFIGVSRDEQHLVMKGYKNNRWSHFNVSLEDGSIEGPVHERNDADIVQTYTDWQRKVIGVRYSGFNPSYQFFDADLNDRVKTILDKFPMHSVWVIDISPDEENVLVYVEGAQAAGDYYLYSKGKQSKYITTARPNIKTSEIHPIGTVNFKARDGLNIPTLVTIPRQKIDSMKNLPAVVLPHGGPESYDTIGFNYMAQALAQQGYLVLQPQFRGSYGLGIKHQSAGYGEWGRKALTDLSDAVSYFAKKGMIDKSKVCIVGSSYGGYSALAGGAFEPNLYKCVVSINGVGNLDSFLNWNKHEKGRSSSSLAYWQAQIFGFDGATEKNKNAAKERSPEFHADSFKAPVLIIYSANDEVVSPRQSVTMYRALKKAGKKTDIIKLQNEDHNLARGETRLQALQATVEFVKKNI